MLTYYLQQTQRLLQNPGAPTSLYSTADLTSYINTIRGQLAGDAQCIRRQGTASTVVGQREYSFQSINLGTPATTGVQGILNVRRIQYGVGSGNKMVYPRPWEWFDLYALSNPVPDSGPPEIWSQYEQGAGTWNGIAFPIGTVTNVGAGSLSFGTFWVDPLPDIVYNLTCDCACFPVALQDDVSPEAIPYQWTDAVAFGAAWMALLSAQTSARMAEAEKYFGYYQQYVQRARGFSNPDVLKGQYEQQPNIALQNQLGVSPSKGGGQ